MEEILRSIKDLSAEIYRNTRDDRGLRDLISVNYRIPNLNLIYHLFIINDGATTNIWCIGDSYFYIKMEQQIGTIDPKFLIDQSEYSKLLECERLLGDISNDLTKSFDSSGSNFITIEKHLISGDYLFVTPDRDKECLNSNRVYIDIVKDKFASREVLSKLELARFRVKKI